MFSLTKRQMIYSQATLFLQLTRMLNPIGIWLLWWPTAWALWIASQGQPSQLWALFFIGTVVMRSAGCIWNDLSDQDIDPHVARTANRPLAAKIMHSATAIKYLILLLGIALLIALQLNQTALKLCFFAVILAGLYPLTKRFFPVPQLFLGLAFAMGVPIAFAAYGLLTQPICIGLTLAALLWPLSYDSIYAMSDQTDDLHVGIYSAPITFGQYTIYFIYGCHTLFILSLFLCGQLLNANTAYYTTIVIYITCLIKQNQSIKQAAFQKIFHQYKWLGVLILIGFILGIPFKH